MHTCKGLLLQEQAQATPARTQAKKRKKNEQYLFKLITFDITMSTYIN